MTHGYEFFAYDYVDLEDYYTDLDDFIDIDMAISEDWAEIEQIYNEYEDDLW